RRHRDALHAPAGGAPGGARMTIAIVIERFDPHRGGAEGFTADLVRWLLSRGHGVAVVAAQWDPGIESECRAVSRRVSFHRIPRRGFVRGLRAIQFARSAAQRVAELKRAGRVDVALDMGWGLGCDTVLTGDYHANRNGNIEALEPPARRAWIRLLNAVS